jgi:2'-hydroxyisoflavone reductase
VQQYVFISTISVYKAFDRPNLDETAPVDTLEDPTSEDVKKDYGALKAACEKVVEQAMPGRAANIRPGLIIGPGDPTGRFTHWPSRLAEGGEVLAPGDGSTPVQWIDVRDLAAWLVTVVEQNITGTYNAIGPAEPTTMKQVVDACNQAGGNKATVTWVDAKFLDTQEVHGWSDLPLWIDPTGDMAGFGTLQNRRAVGKGLTFRPIAETAKDTLAWLATVPEAERPKLASTGISKDRESKVLAAWKARG